MNETPPSLSDLDLFLQVAQIGSLSDTAKRTNIPLPTLSRRMSKLEAQTARKLFVRGKAGYALTADGRALAQELAGLDDVKRRYDFWAATTEKPVQVRITAGIWTSRHLARSLKPTTETNWAPYFLPSNARLDIARREADIGIRNRPPDHPWLARQKLRQVTHAIYAISPDIQGFVALSKSAFLPPSQRWLYETAEPDIRLTAEDTRMCLDLALSGHGRIILPCFAGDLEGELVRLSDPIPELTHDEWLVSHQDARHDPPVRNALDAIAQSLTSD